MQAMANTDSSPRGVEDLHTTLTGSKDVGLADIGFARSDNNKVPVGGVFLPSFIIAGLDFGIDCKGNDHDINKPFVDFLTGTAPTSPTTATAPLVVSSPYSTSIACLSIYGREPPRGK